MYRLLFFLLLSVSLLLCACQTPSSDNATQALILFNANQLLDTKKAIQNNDSRYLIAFNKLI